MGLLLCLSGNYGGGFGLVSAGVDDGGEGWGIPRGAEPAGFMVAYQFYCPSSGSGNNRSLAQHSFHYDPTKGFGGRGSMGNQIAGGHHLGYIGAKA